MKGPRRLGLKPGLLIPALVLVLTAAPPAVTAQPDLGDTDSYRLSLLTIKAHLGTALELLRQRAEFGYHLRTPVQRSFADIRAELERRGAPFDASIVDQLSAASNARDPRVVQAAIETAATAVDASIARSGTMGHESVLALSRELLRAAAGNYARAVTDHSVTDVQAYQTGYGLAAVAASLIRRAGGTGTAERYRRLQDAVSLMRAAWPAVLPPQIANAPATVSQWLANVEEAIATLAETV